MTSVSDPGVRPQFHQEGSDGKGLEAVGEGEFEDDDANAKLIGEDGAEDDEKVPEEQQSDEDIEGIF